MNQFIFLSVATVSLFSFLAVATWSGSRRREREAYYLSEAVKRIACSGEHLDAVLEFLREFEDNAVRQRREGLRLGGLVTFAFGVGMMIFIRAVEKADPNAYVLGVIPAIVGVAVVAHSCTLKENKEIRSKNG